MRQLTVEYVPNVLGGTLARSLVGIRKAAFLRRCLTALGVGTAQAKRDLWASFVGRENNDDRSGDYKYIGLQ